MKKFLVDKYILKVRWAPSRVSSKKPRPVSRWMSVN